MKPIRMNRRQFWCSTACALAAAPLAGADAPTASEPIIDIHQHTTYSGRSNEQLIAHQLAMGVTKTVLLPAGKYYGLDAECGGNATVLDLARQFPNRFVFFANEVPDLPEAEAEIRRYLKIGAIGIGEQKFRVGADSPDLHKIARLAEEFQVPVLMHFQHDRYNTGIKNMHNTLKQFPKVNFIGHAQTWWANVDAKHNQPVLYPTSKVTAGGITDKLLSDYPNMFGDTSAGSGLNFFTRDEEHARAFLKKHQDKLLFGSDCNDTLGRGLGCQGAQILANIRKLSPSKQVERKILYENAKKLLKL
jgi:predicted TIM-barrel fold metal-dependent hydrolase